jgi:hypothetical protein
MTVTKQRIADDAARHRRMALGDAISRVMQAAAAVATVCRTLRSAVSEPAAPAGDTAGRRSEAGEGSRERQPTAGRARRKAHTYGKRLNLGIGGLLTIGPSMSATVWWHRSQIPKSRHAQIYKGLGGNSA